MYCYVLDIKSQDFIESESLFPSDTALLIDNEKRKIYLYSGPKASKNNQMLGEKLATKLLEKYKLYTFEILSDVIPMQLQIEIDLLMGDNKNETREKEPRTLLMQIYLFIVGAFGIVGIILLIEQCLMLGWNYQDDVYLVTVEDFTKFFSNGESIAVILISLSLLLFLISVFTKKLFLIGSNLIASAIIIALWLYIGKREFNFSFPPNSPYSVNRLELFFFLTIVGICLLVLLSIVGFSFYSIISETVPQKKEKLGMDEMRLKSKPSILREKEPVKMEEIED